MQLDGGSVGSVVDSAVVPLVVDGILVAVASARLSFDGGAAQATAATSSPMTTSATPTAPPLRMTGNQPELLDCCAAHRGSCGSAQPRAARCDSSSATIAFACSALIRSC